MKLTILIPVFNEEKTISKVIDAVSKVKVVNVDVEIIVINDGSTDSTLEEIEKNKKSRNFSLISYQENQGKGYAVRKGIEKAKGEYILIQDADLEYNPLFIPELLQPILTGQAQVVYGTRLKRFPHLTKEERNFLFLIHYIGNRFLSLLTSIFFKQWITDMETGYKIFPKKALEKIELKSKGFEFEPEITARLLSSGYSILELPIKTNPRGYEQGKKLNTLKDGFKAVFTLLKYAFYR